MARVSSSDEIDEALGIVPPKDREGRYGGLFGSTVHHAIGLLLRSRGTNAQEAAKQSAKLYGLTEHLEEAAADVTRGVEALTAAGLTPPLGPNLQLEYPIAGALNDGELLTGYIDLVAVADNSVDVIDFKTDSPPPGSVEQTYPTYAAQVRIYGKLLEAAGVLKGRRFRCGLLFTANGAIHWVQS
jgi:ATP-dependent helicase/nuclease subunit A